jgi:hypothetical protein
MSLHLNHYVKERKRPTPLPTPFSRGDLCAWFLVTATTLRVDHRCGERAYMGEVPARQHGFEISCLFFETHPQKPRKTALYTVSTHRGAGPMTGRSGLQGRHAARTTRPESHQPSATGSRRRAARTIRAARSGEVSMIDCRPAGRPAPSRHQAVHDSRGKHAGPDNSCPWRGWRVDRQTGVGQFPGCAGERVCDGAPRLADRHRRAGNRPRSARWRERPSRGHGSTGQYRLCHSSFRSIT